MEYAAGGNAFDFWQRCAERYPVLKAASKGQPAPISAERLALGRHVLQGIVPPVAAGHALGIVHIDMKPENVLLRDVSCDLVLRDEGLSNSPLNSSPH